ncbi:TonB family protein [Sphingopyxis sp.]|jgi:TonB family protein|uniref:energy transducer TonB n=1 Tax=Sphingopyxis sp. TaxID=1908224 RepID=UPI0025FEBBEF|nr:TonB family protein [Sphingopyxis sp.]MBK6412005.1 TonB family protein [Sphingopyxis sp.]
MMIAQNGALTVLALALQPAPPPVTDAITTLEPSSKWNVHYADDYCRLARNFGTGDQSITLLIDRFAPSSVFRLNLVGPPMKRSAADGTATIRFGPDLPEQKLDFYMGDFGEGQPAWIFRSGVYLRPAPASAAGVIPAPAIIAENDEASVTEIGIGRPLRKPVRLRTGSMKGAFTALRTCTDQLLASWGVDAEQNRKLSRPAKPMSSPATWLRPNDYPPDMIRKYQPGLVQFRLVIGEDGRPKSCHIQQSTNPEGFDAAVCKALMRRAEFEPALDENGRPVASYYLNLARFMVP